MLWTSKSTLRVLTADFKFQDANASKKDKKAGKDGKDGKDGKAPAPAAKLIKVMEQAAWGL